jgi:hypothetical protein
LKQRHVEVFVKEMPVGPDAANIPMITYRGIVVRAACKAGWYETPVFKVEDVDDMNPLDVSALFTTTMTKYSEVMGVSPS